MKQITVLKKAIRNLWFIFNFILWYDVLVAYSNRVFVQVLTIEGFRVIEKAWFGSFAMLIVVTLIEKGICVIESLKERKRILKVG